MANSTCLDSRITRLVTVSLIVGLSSAFVAGCGRRGPELGLVTGKVTLDDHPVANAVVTFAPTAGGVASSGLTGEDGTYQLACQLGQGAIVGEHRVYVRSQPPPAAAEKSSSEDDPNYGHEMYASLRAPAFVDPIPARYNTNSELKREVKSGRNVIDLVLTSKP